MGWETSRSRTKGSYRLDDPQARAGRAGAFKSAVVDNERLQRQFPKSPLEWKNSLPRQRLQPTRQWIQGNPFLCFRMITCRVLNK
jgi:allantoicase